MTGVIFACCLGDSLRARAYAGDRAALRLLMLAVPQHMPKRVVLAERDRQIRALAFRLHVALPSASSHRVGVIITAAGGRLDRSERERDRPARLTGSLFDGLDPGELADIEITIRGMLAWLPPHRGGRRWPLLRQVLNVCNTTPVAIAEAADG